MKKTYRLTTPYSERLDRNAVWNEYPRPQFKRNSYINLNGEWDFAVSKENTAPSEYREKILVPFPPESALSGIGRRINKGEKMYYRRGFTLPSDFVRDRVILHFGAVDQIATIYINGKELCRNEGRISSFFLRYHGGSYSRRKRAFARSRGRAFQGISLRKADRQEGRYVVYSRIGNLADGLA